MVLVLVLDLDGCVGTTTVVGCRSTRWCAGTGVVAVRDIRGRCIRSVWAVALFSPGRYLTVGSSQYVVMRKSSRFRSTGVIADKPDSTAEREVFPIPVVSAPGPPWPRRQPPLGWFHPNLFCHKGFGSADVAIVKLRRSTGSSSRTTQTQRLRPVPAPVCSTPPHRRRSDVDCAALVQGRLWLLVQQRRPFGIRAC